MVSCRDVNERLMYVMLCCVSLLDAGRSCRTISSVPGTWLLRVYKWQYCSCGGEQTRFGVHVSVPKSRADHILCEEPEVCKFVDAGVGAS